MNKPTILFVDIQNDFMNPDGKLYVPGVEGIEHGLIKLAETVCWPHENYDIVFTQDYHTLGDKEISEDPDYKTTFPEHCIAGTWGAGIIEPVWKLFNRASTCNIPLWMKLVPDHVEWDLPPEATVFNIQKNAFSVFEGNPDADLFFLKLKPQKIYVCGVTTDVCVDQAVRGLLQRGHKVCVLIDLIQGSPKCSRGKFVKEWEDLGAETALRQRWFYESL